MDAIERCEEWFAKQRDLVDIEEALQLMEPGDHWFQSESMWYHGHKINVKHVMDDRYEISYLWLTSPYNVAVDLLPATAKALRLAEETFNRELDRAR